jgi:hypothetical protein
VPDRAGLPRRLPRLDGHPGLRPGAGGCGADGEDPHDPHGLGGQVNYDDDDDGAIVYLGAPFSSDAVRLQHADVQKIDAKSAELEKWIYIAASAPPAP